MCVRASCSSHVSARCQISLWDQWIWEIHRGPIGVSLPSPRQGGGSQLSPPSPSSHHPIFLSNCLTELLLPCFPPVCVCVFTSVGIRFLGQIQDTEVDSQMFPLTHQPVHVRTFFCFWFQVSNFKAPMNETVGPPTWQQSATCYIKMLWSDGGLTAVRVYIRAALCALCFGSRSWCVSELTCLLSVANSSRRHDSKLCLFVLQMLLNVAYSTFNSVGIIVITLW